MPSYDRPRRRTINEPGHAHFLTFSCYRRWPMLVSDWSRQALCDEFDHARKHLDYELWAYVIMPEHVHVLVCPKRIEYDVGSFRGMVKKRFASLVRERLGEIGDQRWINRLAIRDSDRDKFRFWQKGGGYDENLWNERPVEAVIEYIHDNPCRRGLVDRPKDWQWSSAAWFAGQRENLPLIPDLVRW